MSRRIFVIGFILGASSFIVVNLYSYWVAQAPCCDFFASFGFPFVLGRTGGLVGVTNLVLLGLLANVSVGLVTSVAFAWLLTKVFPPVFDLLRHAGQWHMKTRS